MKNSLAAAVLCFLISSGIGYSQSFVDVSYASASSGADGSIFVNSGLSGFNSSTPAVIAVGWSDGFSGGSSLSGYLSDFNVLDWSNFDTAPAPGFLSASGSFDNDVEMAAGKIGYIFVLAGIVDFADASSATEFAIFNDSSWSVIPTGSLSGDSWNVQSLGTVDNVVFGSQSAGEGFGSGARFETSPVPEPETYALLAGLLGLGLAIIRRRR